MPINPCFTNGTDRKSPVEGRHRLKVKRFISSGINALFRFHREETGAVSMQSLIVLAIAAILLSSYLYIRDDLHDFSRWKISYLINYADQGYDVSSQ